MNCSGMHRGFGVELSFVRSITMDEWSDKQLSLMKRGGNRRMQEFLDKYGVPHLPHIQKYKTKAARFYRKLLDAESEGLSVSEEPPAINEGKDIVEPKRAQINTYEGFG